MSLLIRGATVVRSLSPAVLERVDVAIAGGRIVAADSLAAASAATVLDASGCLVIPGNVNAHMHAYSALARGMAYTLEPPTNFLEILQRIWWRLDRALDPASIRASALVAARDALLSGTTTLIDHHASPTAIEGSLDILAAAFAEVGVRSVLAYEVTDRDGPDATAAGLAENGRFCAEVAHDAWPLSRAMVGAHAAFTLSDATLEACADLCRLTGAGVHIHVAEDGIDRDALPRLATAGLLDERSLLAHCVHVGPPDTTLIRSSGAWVAHNARSNMNNGVGRAPVDILGERVALGTDGIGSDMFEEARAAYFRRRETAIDVGPAWATDRLAAGAQVAGQAFAEPWLGSLAPGAPADLVVLDYRPPTPLEADGLAGHWIFGISAASVRDVVVGGELVVRDRRLTRVDEEELVAQAQEQAARLWRRAEELSGVGAR